jgi:hypothetical protein
MLVGLKRISSTLGLLAAMASSALAQGIAPNPNQLTADAVAGSLRASQNLAGYRIEIQVRDGLVILTGALDHPAQKAEAVARARQVDGVRGVVDRLNFASDRSVRPVQYQVNPAQAFNPAQVNRPGNIAGPSGGIMSGAGTGAAPVSSGTVTSGPVYDGGPVPEGPAGSMGPTQAAQPGYPNYAWPSYAPYPNFSAVGYPTAYPWQAWPNIGPFYPYPEVPLDWRAVTLRWDDGIWWLDFKKHYTRPFFTPYPFGLFAY